MKNLGRIFLHLNAKQGMFETSHESHVNLETKQGIFPIEFRNGIHISTRNNDVQLLHLDGSVKPGGKNLQPQTGELLAAASTIQSNTNTNIFHSYHKHICAGIC